jgi:hypothetical protein
MLAVRLIRDGSPRGVLRIAVSDECTNMYETAFMLCYVMYLSRQVGFADFDLVSRCLLLTLCSYSIACWISGQCRRTACFVCTSSLTRSINLTSYRYHRRCTEPASIAPTRLRGTPPPSSERRASRLPGSSSSAQYRSAASTRAANASCCRRRAAAAPATTYHAHQRIAHIDRKRHTRATHKLTLSMDAVRHQMRASCWSAEEA